MLYARVPRPKVEPKLVFPIARCVGGICTHAPTLKSVHDNVIMAQTKQTLEWFPSRWRQQQNNQRWIQSYYNKQRCAGDPCGLFCVVLHTTISTDLFANNLFLLLLLPFFSFWIGLEKRQRQQRHRNQEQHKVNIIILQQTTMWRWSLAFFVLYKTISQIYLLIICSLFFFCHDNDNNNDIINTRWIQLYYNKQWCTGDLWPFLYCVKLYHRFMY